MAGDRTQKPVRLSKPHLMRCSTLSGNQLTENATGFWGATSFRENTGPWFSWTPKQRAPSGHDPFDVESARALIQGTKRPDRLGHRHPIPIESSRYSEHFGFGFRQCGIKRLNGPP